MREFKKCIQSLSSRLLMFENRNGDESWLYNSIIHDLKFCIPFIDFTIVETNLTTILKRIEKVKVSGGSMCENTSKKTISIPDLNYTDVELKRITRKIAVQLNKEFESKSKELNGGTLINLYFPITHGEKKKLEQSIVKELNFYEDEIRTILKNHGTTLDFATSIERHKKKHKDFKQKISTEALAVFINLLREHGYVFSTPQTLLALLIGYPFGYARKNLYDNISRTRRLSDAKYETFDELVSFFNLMQNELQKHMKYRKKQI